MLLSTKRYFLALVALIALIGLYLSQRFNYAGMFFGPEAISANAEFIFNRVFRYILNDLSVILLLWALFLNRSLIRVAFGIQIFGLLVVLPLYFYFKLSLEGPSEISSPLLSFVHRIVVNPILLLLLIPAFYYQKRMSNP